MKIELAGPGKFLLCSWNVESGRHFRLIAEDLNINPVLFP